MQMKIIKVNKNEITKNQINLIADFLSRGKVIIYPTDTIYGLGCLANKKSAIEKIFKIKKREKKKPLLILVSSINMAKRYCHISKKQEEVLGEVWIKSPLPPLTKGANAIPLTPFNKGGNNVRAVSVILKSRGILPKELAGGGDSLAVRLPKDDFLIKIVRKVRVPLVSTSVNISGEKSLESVEGIEEYFGMTKMQIPLTPFCIKGEKFKEGKDELPDLILDAGVIKGKASMLVDLRDIKDIKILRK